MSIRGWYSLFILPPTRTLVDLSSNTSGLLCGKEYPSNGRIAFHDQSLRRGTSGCTRIFSTHPFRNLPLEKPVIEGNSNASRHGVRDGYLAKREARGMSVRENYPKRTTLEVCYVCYSFRAGKTFQRGFSDAGTIAHDRSIRRSP
jgi:hypothetical protein